LVEQFSTEIIDESLLGEDEEMIWVGREEDEEEDEEEVEEEGELVDEEN